MWTEEGTQTTEMPEIRIAIIGPRAMMKKMEHCLKGFPSFVSILKEYQTVSEAAELARAANAEADVMLFTGEIPYEFAKSKVQLRIPALFVPLTSSSLYSCLFRLERTHGISSLSVDTLSKTMIETALHELGGPEVELEIYEKTAHPTEKDLLQFHREQHKTGRSLCALTAFNSVAVQLAKDGIPCECIVPTNQDIIVTLERALLSTEWRRKKEAQVVMGLIHVDNFSKLADSQISEHEVQRLQLDIHHMVLNFVEHLDGHLTQLAANEYLFVTTRGIFERETGGYKRIPLAKKLERAYGVHLSIGVGFGYSAGEAGMHARQSLRLARDGGGDNCFIVREDESVIGPLEMTEPKGLDLSLVDAALVKKAEAAGLTSIYLSRLISHTTRFGRIDYYAQELASVLGVTTRSVHRFLLAWMDAGLIDIIGEEKGASRGRPRQKYRMTFLNDKKV
ncbi:hypothetical protein [Paenibacillus nasutitermitis]|uniref:Transcriptional regulator n=1 Tax=Paenibacillus nasutitermitis TaxID=1652958 RepID=A0A916ZFL6_9BACL|nr:hypothetical protein [Paenibacillus nasutitermitis]GGD94415.1 hypothetical protein GCM10010911_61350 [Paenibacillus nasutitermitis]